MYVIFIQQSRGVENEADQFGRAASFSTQASMAKEEKQDDSLTETLEEKVHDLKAGAKKEAGVLDTLKGGVESVKGAFSTVTGGVGKAWSTFGEWKEEGLCVAHLCHRLCVLSYTGAAPVGDQPDRCRTPTNSRLLESEQEHSTAVLR